MIKKANYDFFVKINNFLLNLKYYKLENYHCKQTKVNIKGACKFLGNNIKAPVDNLAEINQEKTSSSSKFVFHN